jgi:hypothetical protein
MKVELLYFLGNACPPQVAILFLVLEMGFPLSEVDRAVELIIGSRFGSHYQVGLVVRDSHELMGKGCLSLVSHIWSTQECGHV